MGALTDFHTRVSSHLRRGTKFDADIPQALIEAVRDLELNFNFHHMWQVGNFPVTTGNRDIVFTNEIKSVRFVRYQRSDDTYYYLSKVEPEQVSAVSSALAEGYFFKDLLTIRLDNTADQNYTYEVARYEFSAIDDNLAWLTRFPGLLLAQTVVEMAPLLRDKNLVGFYQGRRDEKLAIALEAETELEFDGADMVMTPYTREMHDAGLVE